MDTPGYLDGSQKLRFGSTEPQETDDGKCDEYVFGQYGELEQNGSVLHQTTDQAQQALQ